MTLLYSDPLFQQHQTGAHPERSVRLARIEKFIEHNALARECRRCEPVKASDEQLLRVHSPEYLRMLERFAAEGGGHLDSDTIVSPPSFDVARHAAGSLADGVVRVMRGEDVTALCLVRPPGHHALPTKGMGFCLLNSVAVAAEEALATFDLDRVLVIDWDVHHGNGTQDIFWESDRVGFFSVHRFPFYPGTGAHDETGSRAGLGSTCNLPLPFGVSRKEYRAAFRSRLEGFADRMKPQLVLISAGFDAHRLDPVGSLGLEAEDFDELSQIVIEIAKTFCGGRLVSVLEGGYNVDVLPDCVGIHLTKLIEHSEQSTS
jgi:acetoin utilization deacetylase AcuC-like enzyme